MVTSLRPLDVFYHFLLVPPSLDREDVKEPSRSQEETKRSPRVTSKGDLSGRYRSQFPFSGLRLTIRAGALVELVVVGRVTCRTGGTTVGSGWVSPRDVPPERHQKRSRKRSLRGHLLPLLSVSHISFSLDRYFGKTSETAKLSLS